MVTKSEEVDLKVVYICLGVIMGMICLVLWASSLVRNGVIQHLMKMQVRTQPRAGNGDSKRMVNRHSSFQDTGIHPSNRCVRAQTVSWIRDPEEDPRRENPSRTQPVIRTKSQHD